jgi:hypothetical protein
MSALAYFVSRLMHPRDRETAALRRTLRSARPTEEKGGPDGLSRSLGAILLLLGFPPFLSLLGSQMDIYEEVLAYVFIFAIGLLLLLIAFVRSPRLRAWLPLCALAGLGGLVRPTLVFYSFATLFAGWLRIKNMRLVQARSSFSGFPDWRWWIGPGLFAAGGLLLFVTNLLRFGDGFEFGHRLNLQNDAPGSMYATRFGHPFQDEPLLSAGKELFGALFLARDFNRSDYYQSHIFPGQSATTRWRKFYLSTFDMSYCVLVLVGWLVGLAVWVAGPRRERWSARNDVASRRESGYLALWSFLSAAQLSVFYLRSPVMSSRYMLDFAPAYTAAILVAYQGALALCHHRWCERLPFIALASWLVGEIGEGQCLLHRPITSTYDEVSWSVQAPSRSPYLPRFSPGIKDWSASRELPFDGSGWDRETGLVMPLVTLFVQDPQFLQLEVELNEPANVFAKPEDIRAKIDLEFLERESIQATAKGWRLCFRGPRKVRYKAGLHIAFVAFVPKDHFADRITPWRLERVQWRHQTAATCEQNVSSSVAYRGADNMGK